MPKEVNYNIIKENMKKNDKFIGDILAPIEKELGLKFNRFDKPEQPKFIEPKKKASLKRKLKLAERKQDKLKKLNPEQAKQAQWKNVLTKAQGVKVKDDPKLIKKAIKRKESDKKRHQKKWAERTEKLEQSKASREKKKKERIQKAKANKTSAKKKNKR